MTKVEYRLLRGTWKQIPSAKTSMQERQRMSDEIEERRVERNREEVYSL